MLQRQLFLTKIYEKLMKMSPSKVDLEPHGAQNAKVSDGSLWIPWSKFKESKNRLWRSRWDGSWYRRARAELNCLSSFLGLIWRMERTYSYKLCSDLHMCIVEYPCTCLNACVHVHVHIHKNNCFYKLSFGGSMNLCIRTNTAKFLSFIRFLF